MAASAARTLRAAAARDLRDTVTAGNLEVDRAPVTNRRYAAFVAATGHRAPASWPQGECPAALLDHPVTGVDFFDALAFALWTDAALPTEEQWNAAAGLSEPSAYVWGDFFDSKRCNTAKSGKKGTTPVGAYPLGAAPSGCVDLCGNVWEMTCTAFPGDSDSIILKGGSWADLPAHARLDTQFRTRVNQASGTVGFRLVYGVPGLLPHFVDRDLVDQCIAFRKADAPHFDAAGDVAEFEAIVESLRQTAGPHLARALSRPKVALVGSGTGAPAPATGGLFARIGVAVSEIAQAAFWKKIMPVIRVFFAPPGRGGSTIDRFRAAWAEAHRPRRGAPLRQALVAAAVALFPDRGRALRARVVAALSRLVRGGGAKRRLMRSGQPLDGAGAAPRQVVRVRGAPPPSMARRIAGTPRRLFVLLCVLAGALVGFYGTQTRDKQTPAEARTEPVAERPRIPVPARPRATAPPAPSASAAAPAREAKPELPSTTRELSREDVETVMRRLVSGRPQEREEAERFLIWHRAETEATLRAALETKLDPEMRAALDYVVVAIAEEKDPRRAAPTVVTSQPGRGLVLVCESLEAGEEIAVVRRTGKAMRLEVTVILSTAGDAARLATTYADDLGDVRFLIDPSFAVRMKLERVPAVVALSDKGKVLGAAYGRVRRSQVADIARKLK